MAQAATCAACGQSNPPGSRFCDTCGQALAAPTRTVEPTSVPTPAATPQSYTPRHLADKILAGREALQGERKQITVLFADVVGSTELVRDRDPEDAQRLLDGAVERMMAAVHRYEGTVSRLQGDGLMAMFGAPVAHEDHAVRACYAALAMLEGVREYAEAARTSHGAAIQIRVGLNSGEVIVRLISDDLHMDYTAMGQTVHLASRMEGLANAGTVLLSPFTLALVEGFVEVRPLGPTSVKGLEQPVEVYELIGAGTARTRLQASAARGLTPFVGRQEELAAIDRALARARAGHGQVVALVAEPGVGKSRLVWEAAHSNQAGGFTVLQAGAVSYGQTTAWLPVTDLLRHYFQIDSRDDHATMRAKVTTGLEALDRSLLAGLASLLALLDVPVQDPAWTQLDPPQRRRATLDAVRRLLLRESQRQPLLLVFEDLHWIDAETQALLDGLVEAIPTARILLLVNYRPEYTHAWGNKSAYTQLRIDPLEQQSAEELLDALLGPDATAQGLKPLLIRRTEGTPLFLEESVRALVETGALIGERGAYRLVRAVADVQVPATVQAVLAARIDRLPPEEKRLLQTAAVIGKDVPYMLLEAIGDVPDAELRSTLSRLQAAELLYPLRLFPDPEYTFKHALTHDVAYGSLLQARRKTLHARIVEAIEVRYPDRLDEHVERMAHHAVAGDVWDKAVTYSRQAGARARAQSDHRAAMASFEQALMALQHLPESHDSLEQAIDLRFDLRNALMPLGENSSTYKPLREAEALATALGDQHRLGRAFAYLTEHFAEAGDPDRAVESGQRALAMAETSGDLSIQVTANRHLGRVYLALGEYRRAIELQRRNVVALEGELLYQYLGSPLLQSVSSRAWLAWPLAEIGDFDEAIAVAEEGLRIAEAVGQPLSLVTAHLGIGVVRVRRGECHEAVSALERGLAVCDVWNIEPWRDRFQSALGSAYVLAGRAADALELLRPATEWPARRRLMGHYALNVAHLSEAHLSTGEVAEAMKVGRSALRLSLDHKERGHQAWILLLLAEIAMHCEPPEVEGAERRYRKALALAEELEMRPLQAHCHLGLGKLYRQAGRLEEARAELSTAVSMLHEMGMTFWLPEAEAELAKMDASGPTETRRAAEDDAQGPAR